MVVLNTRRNHCWFVYVVLVGVEVVLVVVVGGGCYYTKKLRFWLLLKMSPSRLHSDVGLK